MSADKDTFYVVNKLFVGGPATFSGGAGLDRITVTNPTAATSLVQQHSPWITLENHSWDTTAGASVAMQWRIRNEAYNTPGGGACLVFKVSGGTQPIRRPVAIDEQGRMLIGYGSGPFSDQDTGPYYGFNGEDFGTWPLILAANIAGLNKMVVGWPEQSIVTDLYITGKTYHTDVPVPLSNDGAALGSTALSWSDLFLASGAVVNFANGNYTLTHSSGLLTTSGQFKVGGNVLLNGHYLSNDGGDEGISVDNSGNTTLSGTLSMTSAATISMAKNVNAFYLTNPTAATDTSPAYAGEQHSPWLVLRNHSWDSNASASVVMDWRMRNEAYRTDGGGACLVFEVRGGAQVIRRPMAIDEQGRMVLGLGTQHLNFEGTGETIYGFGGEDFGSGNWPIILAGSIAGLNKVVVGWPEQSIVTDLYVTGKSIIGTSDIRGGQLQIRQTTEQLRLEYNATHYLSTFVNDLGGTTWTTTNGIFLFDSVTSWTITSRSASDALPILNNSNATGYYAAFMFNRQNTQKWLVGMDAGDIFTISDRVASKNKLTISPTYGTMFLNETGDGNVVVGSTSNYDGKLQIYSTTEQLRLAYNTTYFHQFVGDSHGTLTITANSTVAGYLPFTYHGIPFSYVDSRTMVAYVDMSTMAAGVGGGIGFGAKVNSGGTVYDALSGIQTLKANATDNDYSAHIVFWNRNIGDPTERMRITDVGNLLVGTKTDAGVGYGKVQIQSTTEQLSLLYDASNHFDITQAGSGGATTLSSTGNLILTPSGGAVTISTTTTPVLYVEETAHNTKAQMYVDYNGGTPFGWVGTKTAHDFFIGTNNSWNVQIVQSTGVVKFGASLYITSSVPASTTNALYNNGGTLYWNGTVIGGGTGITSLNGLIGATQTFTNDTNITIVSAGTAHVITWSGTLADSRLATISTGGKVSGTAITSGNISTSGSFTTTGLLTVNRTGSSYVDGLTLANVSTGSVYDSPSIALTNDSAYGGTNLPITWRIKNEAFATPGGGGVLVFKISGGTQVIRRPFAIDEQGRMCLAGGTSATYEGETTYGFHGEDFGSYGNWPLMLEGSIAGLNKVVVGNPVNNITSDLYVTGVVLTMTSGARGTAHQVIGAQQAAIANATDATSVIARLNDLLGACRTHGLIAT